MIGDMVASVMDEFEILPPRQGVFVADNARNCTTAIRSLVKHYHPTEPADGRRGRCLGHIINLAAQAFIYGGGNEAFVNDADHAEELSIRDQAAIAEEQRLWRKMGLFGKFHNVVRFIRASHNREQSFNGVVKMLVEQAEAQWADIRGGVHGVGAVAENNERVCESSGNLFRITLTAFGVRDSYLNSLRRSS